MNKSDTQRIAFLDLHTEGEPTRIVFEDAVDLGSGSVAQQLTRLREQDWLRQLMINEPRGWEAVVGAVLCKPLNPDCTAGVIFVNNVGYLNMCGHGSIGVAVALHHLGRVGLGKQLLETSVGIVEMNLIGPNEVEIENVPSYRLVKDQSLNVDGIGEVRGDIAWGGNWFFLVGDSPIPLDSGRISELTIAATRVKQALVREGVTGANGAEIDHIEFFGPPSSTAAQSRNFVLCPGGAYDRSPCGTGTSAKLACLAADGRLAPGEEWVQESIIGSRFAARYREASDGKIVPTIRGRAFPCMEGTLIRHADDPFRDGISPID